MRLVVGLGNPGKQYEKTRHNVGFLVVDRCCARAGVEPTKKSFEARYAFAGIGREQVGYVKPLTYMNESGIAVRGFLDFYKVDPGEVLVVCDDLALPCGQLRLRASGSSGGQKGLESIIRHLGTQAFPRLRLGIGAAPPYMDAADYVLGQFAEEERPLMEAAVERAADAVRVWLDSGIDRAMNVFNTKPGAGENGKKSSKKQGDDDDKKEEAGDRSSGPEPGPDARPR